MKKASRYFRMVFLALFVALLAGPPAGLAAAPQQSNGQSQMVVLILAPLVDLYEGDTITLPYMVEDLSSAAGGLTLAPLTPGTAVATAQLGSVSAQPDGLGGSITYTAEKAGQEVISLTVSNYFGAVTGTIELTIKPRPNYDLSFLIISNAQDEVGGGFRAIFTGEGQFANVENAPIEGKGSSDYNFLMWAWQPVFQCLMEPPVQGSASFKIQGLTGPVALVKTPGEIDPFTLNLVFEPMPLNAAAIHCTGAGNITARLDWPGYTADPNAYPLQNLYFPGEGGLVPVTANSTWGYVLVTRKEP